MKISVILGALTGYFETDMKRAAKASERAFKQMKADAEVAGTAIGVALAAGAAAAGYAIKSAIDEMDDIGKTAQKIGVTTEALSGLQYAAELSDVSVGELQGGLTRLVRAQADVAKGSADQAALFRAIGVEALNADGTLRNAGEVMLEVADKFAGMKDGADKTAVAVALFGRAGANLIPLLNGGAGAIADATEELRTFGGVVDKEAAEAAEQFNDNLTRMGKAIQGASLHAAQELLPALNDIAQRIVDMAKDPAIQHSLADAIQTIGNVAIETAQGIVTMTNVLGYLWDEAKQFAGIVRNDDIVRLQERLAGLQGQLAGMEAGRMGESPQAKQLRAEIWVTKNLIAEQEKLLASRAALAGLREIDLSTLPKRKPIDAPRLFSPATGGKESKVAKAVDPFKDEQSFLSDIDQAIEERYKAEADAIAEVKRLKLDSLTSEQRALVELQSQYAELQKLVEQGAVSQEEAAKIAAGLASNWSAAAQHAQDDLSQMSEFAKEAARNMQDAFADFLFDPFDDGLKGMLLDFVKILRRMAAEAIAAKIFDLVAGYAKGQAGDSQSGFWASIASLFAGKKDAGGTIPMGQIALVGERRPELVAGPATVIGGARTATMLQRAANQPVTIPPQTNILVFDPSEVANAIAATPAGERMTVTHVSRNRRALGI